MREKCVALSGSESVGDRLYLVQLPPRPAEPRFARADAWCICCVARQTRTHRRRDDCRCRGHQSFSNNRDRLSSLPALLDSGSQSRCDAGVFSSHFTGPNPRFWTSMARYREVDGGNAQLQRSQRGTTSDAQLHMEKSVSCWRQQSLASSRRCRCCFCSPSTGLRELRRP